MTTEPPARAPRTRAKLSHRMALAIAACLGSGLLAAEEDPNQPKRLTDSAVFGSQNEYSLDTSVPQPRGTGGADQDATVATDSEPAQAEPIVANSSVEEPTDAEVPKRLTDSAVFASQNEYSLDASVPETRLSPLEDTLALAAIARERGRLSQPADDCAQHYYLRALDLDSENETATTALAEIATQLKQIADTEIANGDLVEARRLAKAIAKSPGDVETDSIYSAIAEHEDHTAAIARLENAITGPLGENETGADRRTELLASISNLETHEADHPLVSASPAAARTMLYWSGIVAARFGGLDAADQRREELEQFAPASIEGDRLGMLVQARRETDQSHKVRRADAAIAQGDYGEAERLIATAARAGVSAEALAPRQSQIARARVLARYSAGQRISLNLPDAPEMVVVSAAQEGGLPIALGRTEVTVAQFRQFIETTGYVTDAESGSSTTMYDGRSGALKPTKKLDWRDDFSGERAEDDQPVIHVSWNDAAAYAAWLRDATGERFRLPTSDEFTHAHRGGTSTTYWWGEGTPQQLVANVAGTGDQFKGKWHWPEGFEKYEDGYWGPAPVASFAPNAFDLLDMGGNVMEWVSNCATDDGGANCQDRMIRDASWASTPERAIADFAVGASANSASCMVGFRVARDLLGDSSKTLLTAD